jgi:hypothetical protein
MAELWGGEGSEKRKGGGKKGGRKRGKGEEKKDERATKHKEK